MRNFRPWFGLPSSSVVLALFFASVTASEAQSNLTPPPIPAEEADTETEVVGGKPPPSPAAEETVVTPPPPPEEEAGVSPPPPPPADEIYVSTGGSTEGPFTISELEVQLAAGTFSGQSYVWEDGMADWVRASEVEKLSEILTSAQPEVNTAQASDIQTFLTGIWVDRNATFVAGLGQVKMDMLVEYYADGRMDGIGRFTATNNGTNSVYDVYMEGTWSAQAGAGMAFNLTTNAKISIGLVESPVYTDTFDLNETIPHLRTGPDGFRDTESNLSFTRFQG